MNNIVLKGKIVFEPDNKTKKHNDQDSWKRIAMVFFKGEICEYYSWFVKKRYNLDLSKPLRGAHISFINDHIRDINNGNGNNKEKQALWNKVKKKWDGKMISVVLNTDIRSDGTHWWFIVPEEERELLHSIRKECGLGRPHWGLHMSIGRAVNKKSEIKNVDNAVNAKVMNEEHSEYILKLIRKGIINT